MTPAQLDLITNGAFIYRRADGSRYASLDYRLRDLGIELVGRSGPLTADDLSKPAGDLIDRLNLEFAA
jgi:hypothetical protein